MIALSGYFLLGSLLVSHATEYFVASEGNDGNDGLTANTAFRTVQHGVDALAPGDTLTIGPGEYRETVTRSGLGSEEADTTIKAAIPGTVWLRGDVAAPPFKPSPGYRFIYEADFEPSAQAVNEIDSLSILEQEPSLSNLEFTPGRMYYDARAKKLYISTTDLQPPSSHSYTVSVLDGSGLRLNGPKRVTVSGLAFSGYNTRNRLSNPANSRATYIEAVRWGLLLDEPGKCVIQNCLASFNSGGLGISGSENAGGNQIIGSEAFANYSRFCSEGGNIHISHGKDDVIRDCVAYVGDKIGIRIYNQTYGPVLIDHCLAWGNTGANISMKGGSMDQFGLATNSVAVGLSSINNKVKSSVGLEHRRHPGTTDEEEEGAVENSISLSGEKALNPEAEFADPLNFDFRLQATSRFRKTGQGGADAGAFPYESNVFYVGPGGNDKADGLSAKNAWKSIARAVAALKGGDTLYVLPGSYSGGAVLKSSGTGAVRIAGRGEDTALLSEPLRIEGCTDVKIERIQFGAPVQVVGSREVSFSQCAFLGAPVGLSLGGGDDYRVENCVFVGSTVAGLSVSSGDAAGQQKKGVFLRSNIFDNRQGVGLACDRREVIAFSDYNAFYNGERAWKVGEKEVGLAEPHSRVAAGDFRKQNGMVVLANALDFVGAGALGKPQGLFRPPSKQSFQLTAPAVHSVSDTTANLEWWASHPGTFELEWGEPSGPKKQAKIYSDRFCNFSLTGLKPATEYMCRLRAVTPAESLQDKGLRIIQPELPQAITFRTAEHAPVPRTLYVEPGGDDSHDGLSREQAWKTISHAAAQVAAGDTVLIGDGIFSESINIRATGTPEAPITFKAAPGTRPVLDGDARKLAIAFRICGKQYLDFDGLSFLQFNNETIAPEELVSAIFQIDQSSHITIRRCFLDGRGKGYSSWILGARDSSSLTMSNCLIVKCFNAIALEKCPDTVIEHCVFLRPQIAAMLLRNGPNEKVTFRGNIVTDGNLNKARARMFNLNHIASLVEQENCYWMRLPAEERMLYVGAIEAGGPVPDARGGISIAQFQKFYGKGGSITGDPGFAVLTHLPPKTGKTDARALPFDRLLNETEVPLDFEDLFATNPALASARIGLDPVAFKDFPVKRLPLEGGSRDSSE